MLDEPIERAARALSRALGEKGGSTWQYYIPTVRIVLEAIEEPSGAMVDAGNEAMRGAWMARGLLAPAVAGDAAVTAAWEAMLDRLLGHT